MIDNVGQIQAITHDTGPALVIAGPGSGKTTVITQRIKYLICERCIPPEKILVITFTRASAMEMRQRSYNLLDEAQNVIFGTLHSVFFKLLRQAGEYLSTTTIDDEVNYDDIMYKIHDRLSSDESFRKSCRESFSYIMIDEFQDIDMLQLSIIRLMLGRQKNLFAVGDDDQSIYSFRGANPQIMLNFKSIFKGCRIIALSINYRCATSIVNAAARLIAKNKMRYEKTITSGRDCAGQVKLKRVDNIIEEASYIYDFMQLHPDCEEDIAIILRTNRAAAFYKKYFKEKNLAPSIMTMHGAKGLEFKYVFIPDLIETMVPGRVENEMELEEERRMLYVAMTRAKDELYLLYPREYIGRISDRSSFIDEIRE